jgi:hypothetical protein
MSLIFIDCEAYGGAPGCGQLTEFGAVDFDTRDTFHGIIFESRPDPANPTTSLPSRVMVEAPLSVFQRFESWLAAHTPKGDRSIMVSDNPAFDFQWINHGFWTTLGRNPLGHSARRIGDFYAGLVGDFRASNKWKRLRVTKHDHNPVHDAMGNVEAFARMLKGER